MICPSCGNYDVTGAVGCPVCGAGGPVKKLKSSGVTCPVCGTDDVTSECPTCGEVIPPKRENWVWCLRRSLIWDVKIVLILAASIAGFYLIDPAYRRDAMKAATYFCAGSGLLGMLVALIAIFWSGSKVASPACEATLVWGFRLMFASLFYAGLIIVLREEFM